MRAAPTLPEGAGDGGKIASLPHPRGVMRNGGAEERGGEDGAGGGSPASAEKGRLWQGIHREETAGVVGGGDSVWAGGGYSSPILLFFHCFSFFFSVCFPTVFFFLFVPSSSFQYLLSLDLKMESYVLIRGKG